MPRTRARDAFTRVPSLALNASCAPFASLPPAPARLPSLQADPPDPAHIPKLLGVTVVLLTCSYREKEFIRIGYYVNIEYPQAEGAAARAAAAGAQEDETAMEEEEDEDAAAEPEQILPAGYNIADVTRNILAEKPRVTRFPIDWD